MDENNVNGASVLSIKTPEHSGTPGDFDTEDFMSSLNDMIPEELRAALKETPDEGEPEPVSPPPTSKSKPAEPLWGDPDPEDEEEDTNTEESEDEEETDTDSDTEETDDDDVDTSPESIEKLLKGDVDAVKKKVTKTKETPFWQEEETYKDLSETLDQIGYDKSKVDSLIRKVADKHTIDNSKAINAIKDELEEVRRDAEQKASENVRLRQIERAQDFDNLEDTKEKFFAPMQEAQANMMKILNREGVIIPFSKILNAKNKTELLTLLSAESLSDKDINQITSNWRAYADTYTEYSITRNSAIKSGVEAASTKISPNVVKSLFHAALSDFARDPRNSDLDKAMREGLSKHKDSEDLVLNAQQNLNNFVEALKKPGEVLRDPKWMSALTKFIISAEKNGRVAEKYYSTESKVRMLENSLKKVVKEYAKLAGAAKGISGKKGSPFSSSSSTNSLSPADSEKQAQGDSTKRLEAIMRNPDAIRDIIPDFNF